MTGLYWKGELDLKNAVFSRTVGVLFVCFSFGIVLLLPCQLPNSILQNYFLNMQNILICTAEIFVKGNGNCLTFFFFFKTKLIDCMNATAHS